MSLRSRNTDVRKQAVCLFFYHGVTLTDACFQSGAIDDGNVAPPVVDQARLMQLSGSHRNTFTAHSEHIGDQLLGHDQAIE